MSGKNQNYLKQPQIDEKQKSIMACLRKDSRMMLTKMSKMVNIPVSTLFDRIKSGEKDYILRHTTLLDFRKMGFMAHAKIILKLERESKRDFQGYIKYHPCINSAFKIVNSHDFLLDGIFEDMTAFENFMEEMTEKFAVKKTDVYFVSNVIKKEEFLV